MDSSNYAGSINDYYVKSEIGMSNNFIVILGGGESGVGAALLAKNKEKEVFVSDFGEIKTQYKNELKKAQIDFEESGHDFEKLGKATLVVKSPGVPEKAEVIQFFREKKIPIVSEIEYGAEYYTGTIIGITGSNGKTTTTGLVHHILECGGKNVQIGGNYGISFCRLLLNEMPEYVVLEISSFQLDDIDAFNPDISILLNITPDHLDRYNYQFENYIDAKFKIVANQGAENVFIYNGDDTEITKRLKEKIKDQKTVRILSEDYKNGIASKDGSGKFKLTLKGQHNLFNALCAVEAARVVGVSEVEIAQALSSFKNAPHRLETVALIDNVEFINDSKATNVDATYYALSAMDKGVIWIAGGTDKGNDYSVLFPLVTQKVIGLICLGKDNEKLKKSFEGKVDILLETQQLEEAVRWAKHLAVNGEAVLLTPACASFDLFKNYIDRGDQFKEAVLKHKK